MFCSMTVQQASQLPQQTHTTYNISYGSPQWKLIIFDTKKETLIFCSLFDMAKASEEHIYFCLHWIYNK